jgi:predicted glycoside hydrolase/deacetylase ChbG (UPF0249 family)
LGPDGRSGNHVALPTRESRSAAERLLVVVADDFGIGPQTSRGILELARKGIVTGSVLIVNSPYAAEAIEAWRNSGMPMEIGWHPCLTLDEPIAPPESVPTLVGRDGRLRPLGAFLKSLLLGLVRRAHIEAELAAQYRRYVELVGEPPRMVNTHQHVALFPPVGAALMSVLRRHGITPYVRRVREPWSLLRSIPGGRMKRAVLNALGRRQGRRLERAGFPGNEWLIGLTDPPALADPLFFARWLDRAAGRVVELTCHPGYWDETLIGRDGTLANGLIQRRPDEFRLLQQPTFLEAVRRNRFTLVGPSQVLTPADGPYIHAA